LPNAVPSAEEIETSLTQLAVPVMLKRRIEALGLVDNRPYKRELMELLTMGVAAREKQISK
jgi:hypothetical protein